jgi:hypothetical protein
MVQPTFTQVRVALAATLAAIPGLNTYAEYAEQITTPAAVILPIQGSFIQYATMDGQQNISLRVVLCVARADGTAGQAIIDPYLATSGPQSVFAALQTQSGSTLGGVVSYAALTEAASYGPITVGAIDYLGAHLIVNIGI